MKKTILILSAVTALAASANAQSILAGWHFQSGTGSPFASQNADIGNGTLSSGTLSASATQVNQIGVGDNNITGFRALNGFSGKGGAASDGTFGSGSLGTKSIAFSPSAAGQYFELTFNTTGFQDIFIAYDWSFQTASDFDDGFEAIDSASLFGQDGVDSDKGPFTVSYNAGSGFNTLDYNATQNGTVGWLYSSATTTNLNDVETVPGQFFQGLESANANDSYDAKFGSALNDAGSVTVRFAMNADSGFVFFDNIAVGGTPVPEPATYAAIFGLIALGFVAYRRRV